MIKMQVFLREEQKAALKKMAARTGKRESDLVRQGVDLMLEKSSQETDDWKKATRAAAGIWKDRDMSWFDEMRARTRKRFSHVYGDD
jgi:Arc/MetJ-type ribon-helix-helix transcriptional regulator